MIGMMDTATALAKLPGVLGPVVRALETGANYIWPNMIPPADAIYRAFRSGQLSENQMLTGMFGNGVWPPATDNLGRAVDMGANLGGLLGYKSLWAGVWNSQVALPGPGDIIAMREQKIITEDMYLETMKLNNWWWDDYRKLAHKAYQERLPDPASLVSFALREAWDPAVVARFQYDAEFPSEFKYFMKLAGADGNAQPGMENRMGAGNTTWSQMYWRVHWTQLSPTRAFEMFQRLRPNRLNRFGPEIAGLRAFTFADLQQVLKINDYALPFRPQLAAIAYKKPRLVDITRFYRDGEIDRNEVYELHRDIGYDPALAELRTRWVVNTDNKAKTGVDPKKVIASIAQLYEVGRIDKADAQNRITRVLAGAATIEEWITLRGDIPETPMIRAQQQALQVLQAVDAKRMVANSKALKAAWRRQYLKGMVNAAELRTDMHAAGFVGDRIEEFIALMDAELASGRLMLSTSGIRGLVVDGIMPVDTADRYLGNLGWKQPEREYILTQLRHDLELENAKLAARDARSRSQIEAALIRATRAANAAQSAQVKELNKQATAAQLLRYFLRSIISDSAYTTELRRRGYADEEITRRFQEALAKKAEYQAKRNNPRGRPADASGPANDPTTGEPLLTPRAPTP